MTKKKLLSLIEEYKNASIAVSRAEYDTLNTTERYIPPEFIKRENDAYNQLYWFIERDISA